MLIQNLNSILRTIDDCKTNNNITKEINLVAVSKTKPFSMIEELYGHGHYNFGENRVQDFVEKALEAKKLKYNKIFWHFIGHLQTNKAKHIAEHAHLFQCLDSLKLAEKLNKYAIEYERTLQVLIQINSSSEEQKSGITIQDAPNFIKKIKHLTNLKIMGLMSIGKFNANPEDSRIEFKKMKKLYTECSKITQPNLEFKYLSMGMSNDYLEAIEEGANIVRIGTNIFGQRNY